MKLNDEKNMKHGNRHYCPVCKSSEHTLFDSFHGEIFCANCGYVLHEVHARNSVVRLIEEAHKKERVKKDFLNKKL